MKNYLKYILSIFCIGILFITNSCKDGGYGYEDPFIGNIAGKWYINDESEYIHFYETDYIFEMNDWEVFGNFFINEDKPNEILVIYEDLEGNEYTHTMKLHSYLGSNQSMYVDNAPMHDGERVLMYRAQ